MDDTPMDAVLTALESADPADAPDLADDIATRLSDELEADSQDRDDTPPPA